MGGQGRGRAQGMGLGSLHVADWQPLPGLPVVGTVMALLGKVATAAGFTISYVYSAELFPTVIR